MTSRTNGWLEASIAWEVCASLHRQYCKGKDALFTTRQSDFVKHAEDARNAAELIGAQAAPDKGALAEFIVGMSVSIDVSTGDDDAGNRLFGTVSEVMESQGDKHGIRLLVDEAKPNFAAQAAPVDAAVQPDRTGIYAWVSGSSTAMVLVNKRPSNHAPGGQMNGHVIDSTRFYDGCPITHWGRDGRWTLLHDFGAARAAQEGVRHE